MSPKKNIPNPCRKENIEKEKEKEKPKEKEIPKEK